MGEYVRWFSDVGADDVASVGGKNASLGEMIGTLAEKGIRVPDGFAVTADAYRHFLEANDLGERIGGLLADWKAEKHSLSHTGESIRSLMLSAKVPDDLAEAVREAYRELGRRFETADVDVAVRSSATAEDLPDASFAGEHETFLNVSGEEHILESTRSCFASLFTDRAISYREHHGFEHLSVALSVGIQKMVRADRGAAGVLFTIDTETGFPNVVLINASYGLGEAVVSGAITPDQYVVFKPLLGEEDRTPILSKERGTKELKIVYRSPDEVTSSRGADGMTQTVETTLDERYSFVLEDEEILQLSRWAVDIEDHYGHPMDIEWAKDGETGDLFFVQARPETIHSRNGSGVFKTYSLTGKAEPIVSGLAIGSAIATGRVYRIERVEEIDRFPEGGILVTRMTNPDWVPAMRRAAGIVTDQGGRTSHAAIVSRELGIAAVIGTGDATRELEDRQEVTLSCAEGDVGYVYPGTLEYEEKEIDLSGLPETRTRIMLNMGSPADAMHWWRLPTRGVGLARMEYVINNAIKIHPMALVDPDRVTDAGARAQINELTTGYRDKTDYFVDHLAWGLGTIAAVHYPEPVIVRMSDFKTNEYADLIGGRDFEPEEANPMLGWRGASRYYSDEYREGFALECRAIHKVREEMGLENVIVMIPFCRTPDEADRVLEVMAENGLERGKNGLEVYVMAEIPSNIVLAEEFAERFDGFSIGSNDLTQLTLGVDRDAARLAYLFDERNDAVKRSIRALIERAGKAGAKVGICGQAPSDHADFAAFLVEAGIDSISLTPDSVVETLHRVARMERDLGMGVGEDGAGAGEARQESGEAVTATA
ncbi:MAG TPA: phosphoenolpyruvate synthase [Gemmatimonadota bacterium]|nr:phosphoenolpyruvate synthase [Gemmatimonadota bacterium]